MVEFKMKNKRKLTRREFIPFAAALLAGCQRAKPQQLEKEDLHKIGRFTTTFRLSKIVDILKKEGINPRIRDNKGHRTILEIGEQHLNYGDDYVQFFRYFDNQGLEISPIFLEGVYRPELDEDVLAYLKDCKKLKEEYTGRWEQKITRDDPFGHFRLSKEFQTYGIEDKSLSLDAAILNKLMWIPTMVYKHSGSDIKKDKAEEQKYRTLASKLKKVSFDIPKLPDKFSAELMNELMEKRQALFNKVAIKQRNDLFTEVIDKYLKNGEMGALIVGRLHVLPEKKYQVPEPPLIIKPDKEERAAKGSVEDNLAICGINTVYITCEQIREFNCSVK
jgi:hypothetical protein